MTPKFKTLLTTLKPYLKLTIVSLISIIVVAIMSVIYGLIAYRLFTFQYFFIANFSVAAVLITGGIILHFIPSFTFMKSKLLDHSTYVERSFDSRDNRQKKARLILWWGIYNILITGLIEVFIWLM